MTMPGLIAKKVGMTRMIDDNGNMIPVTIVEIENQKVTKVLTPERDGYHGIQVGYYTKREKLMNKPDLTRLRKVKIEENYTRFKEFRTEGPVEGFELGVAIAADKLEGITAVDVSGFTKGRGFQGSTKRWNTKTGRRTHGSHFHRSPGSLGQTTTPGRVMKGKKLPGHMGNRQRTIQNLVVMDVDTDNNVVAIKGAVPGHREGYIILKPSVKTANKK